MGGPELPDRFAARAAAGWREDPARICRPRASSPLSVCAEATVDAAEDRRELAAERAIQQPLSGPLATVWSARGSSGRQ